MCKKHIKTLKVTEYFISDFMSFVAGGISSYKHKQGTPVSLNHTSFVGQAFAGMMLSDGHICRVDLGNVIRNARFMVTLGYNAVSISMLASILYLLLFE